jgi:hypothetical protein
MNKRGVTYPIIAFRSNNFRKRQHFFQFNCVLSNKEKNMNTMSRTLFVLSLAVIASFGLAAAACADIIKTYDFDSNTGGTLTLGNKLIDQDNWVNLAVNNNTVIGSGVTGWTGKYALAGSLTTVSDTAAGRTNNDNWTFSLPANEDFDVSAVVYCKSASSNMSVVGFQPHNTVSGYTGLVFGAAQTSLKWYNNSSGTVAAVSNAGKTYLVGVHVDARGSGEYWGQAYYQDLTSGTEKMNVGSEFLLVSDPTTWDALYCRLSCAAKPAEADRAKLDNITLNYVPEPSAAALLAMSLMGPAAFARRWRRK